MTLQEAIDVLEKDSLIYNDEAWQTLKNCVLTQQANNNAMLKFLQHFVSYIEAGNAIEDYSFAKGEAYMLLQKLQQ